MEVSTSSGPPETKAAILFRSKPINNLLAFVFTLCLLVGSGLLVATQIKSVSGWQLLYLAPVSGIFGFILLIVSMVCWSAFKASLRPTNWSIVVREQELIINLRDYRNAQPGEETPYIRIPSEELERAVQVTEQHKIKAGNKTQYRCRRYIDLYVPGVETSALKQALRDEARHPGVVGRKGGKTKVHQPQVIVMEDQMIRLKYTKKLKRALELVVPFAEPILINLDKEWEGRDATDRALEFTKRGERIAAFKALTRDGQMTKAQASEWLKRESEAA